jgi:ferrous iron transport protein B
MSGIPKKIALVGNPNSGKSLIFSRVTGIGVISANYPGTTVELSSGPFKYRGADYRLLDLPGIYSLEAFSQAEETALRLIGEADGIINVVDATGLERNLSLTLQLARLGKPMVVCLNFWDDTEHKGIEIDTARLAGILDVPVITTSALRGEGISDLVASIGNAKTSRLAGDQSDPWRTIGEIVSAVQKLSHRHHSALEWLSDFTLHPFGGLTSAAAVLIATFTIVRFLGEAVARWLCEPLFSRFYRPLIVSLSSNIPLEFIRDLLIGAHPDPLQSFGILTTGVYIALVLVFPYFFSFYAAFGFLEDFGYLPRLAVVLDAFFHRLGLHGYSSIPIMLGLGCKVPAILATRVLTGKREKLLTAALILMSAPCLPQSIMILSLGMRHGIASALAVFSVLLLVGLGANAVLQKITKGELPELSLELPSYRLPSVRLLARKLWLRILDYFREILPLIAVGVLAIHILEKFGAIQFISRTAGRALSVLLGLPGEIAPVLLLGFLRKDVSIALLAPFHLSAPQFVVACMFMVLYVPCIASLFTLIRELGLASALSVALIALLAALGAGGLLHAVFAVFL